MNTDLETRDDPRYVKWIARYYIFEPEINDYKGTVVPMHKCTSEDFA